MVFGDEADEADEFEERVQNLLMQFPGKELRIRSALVDFEGHAGRAALELQNEADNPDAPGRYVIVARSYVKAGIDTSTAKVQDVCPERIVEVAEVAENTAAKRIRGRLVEPDGWISLMDTETGQRWAEKVDDEPGEYRIVVPVHVKLAKELNSVRVADIPRDAIVNVAEVQLLKEDKRVRGRIDSPCDGWISLQSTENGVSWAKRIVKLLVKRYRVDNKQISSSRAGLNFRLSPHLDDKDQSDDKICLYGSIVTGVKLQDWLRLDMEEGGAARYLPFNVQGMRVLYEVDENDHDILPEGAAHAGVEAPPSMGMAPAAKVPALDFSPAPRSLTTPVEDVEAMMCKLPSARLPYVAYPAEVDDADGDREFEVEASLEGFPEPKPNLIFGTDPRAPLDSQQGVGVIAFCFPGYPERWDELCRAPFLGHHWDLGPGGISVACKETPEAPRHFCNAEAAFHALKFWDQAERFEGLTGEEASALNKELLQNRDPTFAGHGSEWNANLAVLRAKFRPGSPNAEALLRTQDSFVLAHVAEAFNNVWSNNHVGDGKNWNGLQLMLVRDEISGRSADMTSWTQFIRGPCQVDLETGDCRASSASDSWSDAVIGATDALHVMLGETIQRRRQTFSGLSTTIEMVVEGAADGGLPRTSESHEVLAGVPGPLPEEHGDKDEPPTEIAAPTDSLPASDVAAVTAVPDQLAPPGPQADPPPVLNQPHEVAGVADSPPASSAVDSPEPAADPAADAPQPRRKTWGRTLSSAFRNLEANGSHVPATVAAKPVAAKPVARPTMVKRTLSKAFAARQQAGD